MTWLLFALLAAGYLLKFNSQYSALIVMAVAAFVALDVGIRGAHSRYRNLARLTLVLLVIFLVVVGPTLLQIYLRHTTAPYAHIHDGAIQIEEAVKFLLAGTNPYGADYASTPMALWVGWPEENPALHHNIYLPLVFLITLPFYLVFQSFLGWFDVRFVYLILFMVMLFLLLRLNDDWEEKLGLLIAFGLNPLFVPFFYEWRNDVLVLFGVVVTLGLLQRSRFSAAAIAFGLTCATKQTALFIAPFFFAHLLFGPFRQNLRVWIARCVIPFVIQFTLILLPFMVWNVNAFINDTLFFQFTAFAAEGYGISQIMLLFGLLQDRMAPFPFFLLMILFVVPTVLLL